MSCECGHNCGCQCNPECKCENDVCICTGEHED